MYFLRASFSYAQTNGKIGIQVCRRRRVSLRVMNITTTKQYLDILFGNVLGDGGSVNVSFKKTIVPLFPKGPPKGRWIYFSNAFVSSFFFLISSSWIFFVKLKLNVVFSISLWKKENEQFLLKIVYPLHDNDIYRYIRSNVFKKEKKKFFVLFFL